MKSIIVLFLFVAIFNLASFGQYKVMPQPIDRVINVDGQWRDKDSRTSSRWDVDSDRNNNQVYSDNNFSSAIPGFKLNFGETVYVLDYNPGRGLLIARPQLVDPTGKFIGNTNTEMGWVKEESMVLSRYGIRTTINPLLPAGTNGLYTKKAFIFNRPGNYKLPTFYSSPNMNAADSVGSFNIYTIFYIYKEVGNKLLLGQMPEKKSMADKNLIGWITRNVISPWNHNMCFEKNWNADAVNDRSATTGHQKAARIFSSESDSKNYQKGQQLFMDPILYNEDDDTKFGYASVRMDGNIFRSPIIKTIKQDSLFEVGFLSHGAEKISSDESAAFLTCFKSLLEQLNTINLVFLIDGTHSIIPYKKTIVDNMVSAFTSLGTIVAGGNIKIRYNAFIYRDDPYPHPFSAMTPIGMTSDFNKVVSFINNELVTPPPVIDDQPEAMYWGFKYIDQRLDDIKPFEKTFIIVLGDAGNHNRTGSPTLMGDLDVLNILKKRNYSVSAIQINHKTTDPAFSQFQDQFKNLITRYYRDKFNIRIPSESVQEVDSVNHISRFPDSSLKIPSMLIYPQNGKELSQEALGKQLTNLILAAPFADFKTALPCNIPPSILSYLKISPKDPEFTRKALYGMFNSYYLQGYLPQFSGNDSLQANKFRFFNDVQYFKTDELKNIDDQLKILIPDDHSPSHKSPRERLIDAWRNILVEKLKVIDASKFNSTTLREASLFLTQNKGRTEWANITMMDINTLSKFPDNLLVEYFYDWFTTKIMIQSILSNSSQFTLPTMKQHSSVFRYCYELIHPSDLKTLTGAQIQNKLNSLYAKAINFHYAPLHYTNDNYIQKIARCRGDIVTMTIDSQGNITKGSFLEAFWTSGEYFPHQNNYANLIFN